MERMGFGLLWWLFLWCPEECPRSCVVERTGPGGLGWVRVVVGRTVGAGSTGILVILVLVVGVDTVILWMVVVVVGERHCRSGVVVVGTHVQPWRWCHSPL